MSLEKTDQNCKSLGNESSHTQLGKVEATVNSKLMTKRTISDPSSPTNLPTMKLKVMLLPSRCFWSPDIYCQKRWRWVQQVANEIWSRIRKEFLWTLQEGKTCKTRERNFRKGDLVLRKTENRRSHWPVARIIETFADKNGVVRIVRLKPGSENNAHWELVRPIAKIVLLVEDKSLTESQGLNQN